MNSPTVESVWGSVPLVKRMLTHLTFENISLVLAAVGTDLDDGARWRFLVAALTDANSPEAAACLRVKNEHDAAINLDNMTAMVDAARIALKEQK